MVHCSRETDQWAAGEKNSHFGARAQKVGLACLHFVDNYRKVIRRVYSQDMFVAAHHNRHEVEVEENARDEEAIEHGMVSEGEA